VFTYHHALLDTSVVWAVGEAFQAYDSLMAGADPTFEDRVPYHDHISWLQGHLAANKDDADAYFAGLLDGFDEPNRVVAIERTDGEGVEWNGVYGADRFALSQQVSDELHALAAEHGLSLGAAFEAAWALIVSSFSGNDDVVFGSTRGCRRSGLAGSESIMGLFINTPPVRVTIDPTQTVRDLVAAVRRQQQDKRAFEHTPLSDVHASIGLRSGSLFETIVVINELHQGTRLRQLGGQFEHRSFDLHDQTNFPLTLLVYGDPLIHCKLSYDPRRFTAESVERVRLLLCDLLAAMAASPDRPVAELPRLTPAEQSLLAAWNATDRDYPAAATIADLFEAQVARTPDAVAAVFRDRSLTYRQLDERANEVAALLQAHGVGPDDMVGVYIDRSLEMAVGLLGILKAGGAYVPMDPNYPSVRIGMMIEDARTPVVLTHSRLRDSIPGSVPTVVALDEITATRSAPPPRPSLRSDHLAYVIFTSGSTGRPKGVMIEHRNVANFFVAMDDQLGFRPGVDPPGRWLAVTSISFDISVLEIFWTLCRGFTVVLQQDDALLSAEAVTPGVTATRTRKMDFSLFYFAADATSGEGGGAHRYRLLLEGAKFADAHGFSAVWTPERHFHEFGGVYPNAAITSTAVAMVTERVGIRAGSVVVPLHHPIRLAEDWSVVDNLSNGRVGLSFASGWHANDFALAPANYANRREVMAEGIDIVRRLWRGESVGTTAGDGREIQVTLYPSPVQSQPPMWITAGGSPDTFAMAGRLGANILTNLLVMSAADLVKNVAAYRQAYRDAGHPGDGHVSVMLHTFVGDDEEEARRLVREPFLAYLRSSTDLINKMQWERTSFAKAGSGGGEVAEQGLEQLSDDDMAALMDHAFERYVTTAGLFGTPQSCVATIERLSEMGVDEVACLIDFGVAEDAVLDALTHLDELRRMVNQPSPAQSPPEPVDPAAHSADYGLVAQIHRHGITHLQCTPSHAAIIAEQPGGLDALGSLQLLMVGGEALPPAVADRVRPALNGRMLNMYGPTETTIWSTVSEVARAGDPITIGRPIANTTIHIVSRSLRDNPLGVPGELLIGGAGVVRGYLDRPELTAERFVTLPSSGQRVYRTGDLARFLPDGRIEFSGRLDHQVKIRGYRIELGEIEATIGRHPDVFENVVVAHTAGAGDPRLIAYVVPRKGEVGGADAGVSADVAAGAWGEVWDEAYRHSTSGDATFDVAGWNDSYTGDAIPAEQMAEWVDEVVSRISSLQPARILEVGSGTGLLLLRLAPTVQRYVGIDAAAAAVERVGAEAARQGLAHVEVLHGLGHQLSSIAEQHLADERFDTIVINSVAQYFPDAGYLVSVISQAMALLSPGGRLFMGDLRAAAPAHLFAAAVELERSSASTSRAELARRAADRAAGEEELVIDPQLFAQLRDVVPQMAGYTISLRGGTFDNEMTRFRYDAVLHAAPVDAPIDGAVVTVAMDTLDVDAVRAALSDEPSVVRLEGVRNDRLVREAELVRLLAVEGDLPGVESVADLRAALHEVPTGVRMEHVAGIDPRYETWFEWSTAGVDRVDIVLRHRYRAGSLPSTWADSARAVGEFTNQPAVRRGVDRLGPELRGHVRDNLPDYMVPTAFVVLDALPRTPNGKVDRAALPSPDTARTEGADEVVAPANDIESTLAAIWQDLLALDVVGVETNLFDLGANSLLMVRANSRLRETLGRSVSLVEMFRFPTVRLLADHLGGGGADAQAEVLKDSQERGQARNEALQRRRAARRGS
jgi:natural product biosynthesis luciferase-like monooxygenase protein